MSKLETRERVEYRWTNLFRGLQIEGELLGFEPRAGPCISGSIFFLKLGKGKSKFLDEGIDKIKSGLSYSFKFLNSLQKIYINGEEIKAQAVLDYSQSFPIDCNEFKEINPKNKI